MDVSKRKYFLLRKIIKNTIMTQFYHNCVSINRYFNRNIPMAISVFLATLIQTNGGVLLTLLAIVFSKSLDGIYFISFFSFLALAQTFLQAQKDYKTYDSLYEQTIFVYGYNNKRATICNAWAYTILNIINNPAVFVPFIFYTAYFYKNILIVLIYAVSVLLIYQSVFFYNNVRIASKDGKDILQEIGYIIKSIIFVFLFVLGVKYMKDFLITHSEITLSDMMIPINELFKVVFYWTVTLAPMIVGIICMCILSINYAATAVDRCHYYMLEKEVVRESKYIIKLAGLIKDKKVKSDLLIIGRRKDLWKHTAVLSIMLPNTSLILIVFIGLIMRSTTVGLDVESFIFTAFIFEIYVIYNYLFKVMSFMLFHSSELGNIELYRMSKKDRVWLLNKKIKLMNVLGFVPLTFTYLLFAGVILILQKWWLLLWITLLAIGGPILFAYINLYWMFHYKVDYTSYEEFGTKIIHLSSLSKYASIPGILFILPFLANIANYLYGEILVSTSFIFSYIKVVVILFAIFSFIILNSGLRKYGK